MTISDAQFATWLQTDVPRVVLAEATYPYESAGARATNALYFCSGRDGYRTEASDTPASVSYRPVLEAASFEISLDMNSLGGMARFTPGVLTLNNADGALDLMKDIIVDGWEVNCYLGAPMGTPGWSRSDFRKVLVALMDRVSSTTSRKVSIALTDKRLLLGQEVRGTPMGGSGPNATRDVPLVYGYAENVDLTPYLYDESTIEYAVLSNYGGTGVTNSTLGVNDVRDAGGSLRSTAVSWTSANTTVDAATDIVTHVGHTLAVDDVVFFRGSGTNYSGIGLSQVVLARPFAHGAGASAAAQLWVKSVPSADTVTFSLTKGGATLDFTATGWNPDGGGAALLMTRQRYYDTTQTNGRIRLSSKATGRVTADVLNGYPFTGTEGNWNWDSANPFNFAAGLMYGFGNIVMADIDTTSVTAADATLDAKCATGLATLYLPQRQNLVALLSQWVDAFFGFFGQDNTGKLIVGLVDPSGISAATATQTLTEDEVMGDLEIENLQPTINAVTLQYQLNHAVQKDGLLSSLVDSTRTYYSNEFNAVQESTAPSGTAYSTNPALYHKSMTGGPPARIDLVEHWPNGGFLVFPVVAYSNEIVADRAPHLQVLRVGCRLDKYAWKLGDVVSVTHSRMGLSAGKKFRVVGLAVDLIAETVRAQLLTQTTPTYTTASYTY